MDGSSLAQHLRNVGLRRLLGTSDLAASCVIVEFVHTQCFDITDC